MTAEEAEKIISSGYRFVPDEKDIEKMRYYFSRKTDPKNLAEESHISKIIARLFIAKAMDWSDAVYALKFKAIEYGFDTNLIAKTIEQGKEFSENLITESKSEMNSEICIETAIRDLKGDDLEEVIDILMSEFDENSFKKFIVEFIRRSKPEDASSMLESSLNLSEEAKYGIAQLLDRI